MTIAQPRRSADEVRPSPVVQECGAHERIGDLQAPRCESFDSASFQSTGVAPTGSNLKPGSFD